VSVDVVELVGYAASALVVASLAMTSVVRLRTISLAGSITFVAYGLLIGSIPIVLTNASIAGLNVWFLAREFGGGRDLGAVVVPPDSPFLVDFLAHHERDITTHQPEYDPTTPADFALVLTRDGLPAGVVLGDRRGTRLDIRLDYVLRAYRDSRLGRWLFGPGAGILRTAGVEEVSTLGGSESHRHYLTRIGFAVDPTSGRFVRRL
jgi:hypothetical protein